MRMPFLEFLMNGDLKFIITFIVLISITIIRFIKKINAAKTDTSIELHNHKIQNTISWMLLLSTLSLFLGLMHSFYFIGKMGGIAPKMIFQGVANTLITPVLGICLSIVAKILLSINFKKKNV